MIAELSDDDVKRIVQKCRLLARQLQQHRACGRLQQAEAAETILRAARLVLAQWPEHAAALDVIDSPLLPANSPKPRVQEARAMGLRALLFGHPLRQQLKRRRAIGERQSDAFARFELAINAWGASEEQRHQALQAYIAETVHIQKETEDVDARIQRLFALIRGGKDR